MVEESQKLKVPPLSPPSLPPHKVHCYRAVLEKLLCSRCPAFRHTILKTVPRAHSLAFAEYVHRSVTGQMVEQSFYNRPRAGSKVPWGLFPHAFNRKVPFSSQCTFRNDVS